MGKRGPRKTPAETKKRRGTYRKDRDAAAELSTGIPIAPPELSTAARKHWAEITTHLAAAELVADLDGTLLALLCESLADYWKARNELTSFTAITDKGNVIQHPTYSVMKQAEKSIIRIAGSFGMSPSDRTGLVTNNGQKDNDPLAEAFKGRAGLN